MANPDPGPLLDEHLDELELICRAGEVNAFPPAPDGRDPAVALLGKADEFDVLDYVIAWHDRHDRKLLEAARWALANGWRRPPPEGDR